ncbi:cupin domain-containing protein [Fibrella sp. USSR17]
MAQQMKTPTMNQATQGPATSFSGTVWVTTLVGPNTETDCIVSSVEFTPRARTHWHTHPAGQLLVVTQGTGFYQEKGKPARVIREGESVTIPPMVEHWHGAGPNGPFTHIAINPNVSKGGAVNWLEAVTDEAYTEAQ